MLCLKTKGEFRMNQMGVPDLTGKMDGNIEHQSRIGDQMHTDQEKTRVLVETCHLKTRTLVAVLITLCTVGLAIINVLQMVSGVQLINAKIDHMMETVNEIQVSVGEIQQQVRLLEDMEEEIFDIRNEVENLHINTIMIRDKLIPEAAAKPEPTPEPKPEPEIVDQPDPVEYNTSDLLKPSGFTAEQFQEIINTTFATKFTYYKPDYYADFGAALYEVEQNWGFNALYLLGISGLESGYGTSGLATKSNNSFGLIGMKFDTIYDSIMYEGELIKTAYIDSGRTNLVSIGEKYCPPTYEKWAKDVQWITNQYIDCANALVEGIT